MPGQRLRPTYLKRYHDGRQASAPMAAVDKYLIDEDARCYVFEKAVRHQRQSHAFSITSAMIDAGIEKRR